MEKVDALIRASREVERILDRDATRAQIGEQVSDAGKNRFWSHWPE